MTEGKRILLVKAGRRGWLWGTEERQVCPVLCSAQPRQDGGRSASHATGVPCPESPKWSCSSGWRQAWHLVCEPIRAGQMRHGGGNNDVPGEQGRGQDRYVLSEAGSCWQRQEGAIPRRRGAGPQRSACPRLWEELLWVVAADTRDWEVLGQCPSQPAGDRESRAGYAYEAWSSGAAQNRHS